ncbi:MAG: hypothetical protein LUC30_01415 [Clostridiales bacterium]|nr:hypothetical protein [Clostridiales bacterium]
MKRLVKNFLIVLLVMGAALLFSLQLRWLAQRGVYRYSGREQMTMLVYTADHEEESGELTRKDG